MLKFAFQYDRKIFISFVFLATSSVPVLNNRGVALRTISQTSARVSSGFKTRETFETYEAAGPAGGFIVFERLQT